MNNTNSAKTSKKMGYELRCSGRVNSSGARRVALVIKPDTRHELRKGQIVITTNGTYPWSFMT